MPKVSEFILTLQHPFKLLVMRMLNLLVLISSIIIIVAEIILIIGAYPFQLKDIFPNLLIIIAMLFSIYLSSIYFRRQNKR